MTELIHPEDILQINVSPEGELLAKGAVLRDLTIRTDEVPIRVDAIDPRGMWIFVANGEWRASPSGGVFTMLEHTAGDRFIEHEFVIHPAGNPAASKPKPLPIKIKPIVVAPDDLL